MDPATPMPIPSQPAVPPPSEGLRPRLRGWLPAMGTLKAPSTPVAVRAACRQLDPQRHRIVWLPGGHHFNGDYAKLAQLVLQAGRR